VYPHRVKINQFVDVVDVDFISAARLIGFWFSFLVVVSVSRPSVRRLPGAIFVQRERER
jgi:hypothetical protein